MGDILSKLKMVSEKVGVTETAHTIEEQIDLISESLDKVPASTNIAEALDDLSEVAQNINNGGGEFVEINMTIDAETGDFTSSVSIDDAIDAVSSDKNLLFIFSNDGRTITTALYKVTIDDKIKIICPDPYCLKVGATTTDTFIWKGQETVQSGVNNILSTGSSK
jgi:hypothetical protein